MKTVFVIGAGPAGLFAAQKIALAGHETILFNRDIKPGGLAEYGIYPTKDKMKVGLRKQFAKVLSLPNVYYMGHVTVGGASPVTISALREFSPAAMVFAVGAQGTKKLGLPGSEALGVYSAKDFVYHYNLLPPFAGQDFSIGKKVAIVGMGNVMVDIARWLLLDSPRQTAEEITVIARRGPFEAKFDQKEFAYVEKFLDRQAFQDELRRVQPHLARVGQDVEKLSEATFPILAKPASEPESRRLLFRFLSSPQAVHAGAGGRIERLSIGENTLVPRGEDVAAQPLNSSVDLDVDTMIFAIGDVADPSLGLPYAKDAYITHSDPTDPKRVCYEILNPETGGIMKGSFAVGWARKASEGLVGIARHDAEQGATCVNQYLANIQENTSPTPQEIRRQMESLGLRIVDKGGLEHLGKAEEAQAKAKGIPWFKFADDGEMLAAIEDQKTKEVAV